jgi:hypothetical protein
VPEALAEINSYDFDVLISDLNIEKQGDGFLVVSAMRHNLRAALPSSGRGRKTLRRLTLR